MKTAVITGANKGIGFAIAKSLGIKGWHVIIGARNKERAETAVTKLQEAGVPQVDYVLIDLSDPETIEEAVKTIQQDFSTIDLLVNNAGIPGGHGSSLTESIEDLQTTMQVNFFGTFQLTQGLLPILEKNNGRIVNITIPTEANPFWNPFAYKSTKAAQNVMMQALAIDFEKDHKKLEIFSIHLGPTTTDLNGNITAEGFHTPDDVAEKISDILLDGNSHQGEFLEIYGELK
ncbi:NAD(P)-dependent dehydrogenase, short-chain alcohol dehydrogenase family [Enterococcus malodoratus]|uniref:SDR family NAD(P)-dependent oxidoreductase n=1 Tax=Enterococcus malodoratus TaxID=71451 RepID=UPI0008B7EFED|nr:SDR family NAD(P)-dependent oxidoreductase [Enterococcus malodoratus]SET10446.1 NAD(P)-dependent dehydrogenase, short-chain alcohol dehydrogenase family [Enterococcus malodoratus]